VRNLLLERGAAALDDTRRAYPGLDVVRYGPGTLDLETELAPADLVLVHAWNDPALVAAIGAAGGDAPRFARLFHDTHHRAVTAPERMAALDLSGYDGVLASGESVRRAYAERRRARRAWTWHEAADVRVFRPRPRSAPEEARDIVWIGNWGDGERSAELREFVIGPVRRLGLSATAHGVRYPSAVVREFLGAGIEHRGSVANYDVPEVFARHRATVHVPRSPYAAAVPGVPTIRVFEALACGIPLVSAPWDDAEGLFRAGDFLFADDGAAMESHLRRVLREPSLAADLAASGLETVLARHTCAHRADELLEICSNLGLLTTPVAASGAMSGAAPSPWPARARAGDGELSVHASS
jgi:spore maturation protein CgeB